MWGYVYVWEIIEFYNLRYAEIALEARKSMYIFIFRHFTSWKILLFTKLGQKLTWIMYLWAIFLRENLMLFPPYVSSSTAELCGFDYLKAFCRLWSASCCWLGRRSTAMRRLVKKKDHIVRFITYYSIEINFFGVNTKW